MARVVVDFKFRYSASFVLDGIARILIWQTELNWTELRRCNKLNWTELLVQVYECKPSSYVYALQNDPAPDNSKPLHFRRFILLATSSVLLELANEICFYFYFYFKYMRERKSRVLTLLSVHARLDLQNDPAPDNSRPLRLRRFVLPLK